MATGLSLALGQAQGITESRAPLNALTIDIEPVCHGPLADRPDVRVEVGARHLINLLDEAGVRATFFVQGWIAQCRPDLVCWILRQGHEIGSLGYEHEPLDFLTPESFKQDLRRCRQVLEDLAGKPVNLFRAPDCSIGPRTLLALDVLIEEGYQLDASIDPSRRGLGSSLVEPHRIEREGGHIWEFPLPVWRILGWPVPIGRGTSLRCLPYALTRRRLQGINSSGLRCSPSRARSGSSIPTSPGFAPAGGTA